MNDESWPRPAVAWYTVIVLMVAYILSFIDRVVINDPKGEPRGKGSNRLVFLAAPVKDPSGANVQLVIGGLTEDPSDAPGAFEIEAAPPLSLMVTIAWLSSATTALSLSTR